MTIFLFALQQNLKQRISLLLLLVLPLVLLFIPSMTGSLPMGFSLFGLLNLYSAFLLTRPIVEDRMQKIVVRIAASPISHAYYLSSHLLASLLLLAVQCLVFVVASILYFGPHVTNYLVLFLLYVSYSAMVLSLSLAWNSMFRSYNTSFALFSGIGSIMCLVSGLSFPLSLLPQSVQTMVRILPTYYLANGLLMLGKQSGSGVLLSAVVLWVFTGIFLLIGSKRRF
ncbi:MAG: ABC transporter permease [Spirochaetales bacterium]|nr:ABC transporter permease [Sphaerochaeta sp.]NLE16256.1 ABC transporter permease [Spirochaetales bacterium]